VPTYGIVQLDLRELHEAEEVGELGCVSTCSDGILRFTYTLAVGPALVVRHSGSKCELGGLNVKS
jgi:hypothetical protein